MYFPLFFGKNLNTRNARPKLGVISYFFGNLLKKRCASIPLLLLLAALTLVPPVSATSITVEPPYDDSYDDYDSYKWGLGYFFWWNETNRYNGEIQVHTFAEADGGGEVWVKAWGYMIITIVFGDFEVSVSPSSRTISQGSSTSYTVTVTSTFAEFSQPVTLSVTGLPAGASYSFSSNPVTPPAGGSISTTLSVSTSSSTPTGTYTLTITGTSYHLTRSAQVTLEVSSGGGSGGGGGGGGGGNYLRSVTDSVLTAATTGMVTINTKLKLNGWAKLYTVGAYGGVQWIFEIRAGIHDKTLDTWIGPDILMHDEDSWTGVGSVDRDFVWNFNKPVSDYFIAEGNHIYDIYICIFAYAYASAALGYAHARVDFSDIEGGDPHAARVLFITTSW